MAEKTLKATAKKLRDARKKGQVPKSKEVIAAAVLCALVLVGAGASDLLMDYAAGLFALGFEFDAVQRDASQIFVVLERAGLFLVIAVLVVAALEFFPAVIAGFLQTRGLVLSFDPILPKFERLNPAENAKKLFSLKQVYEVVRKLVVIAIFSALLAQIFKMLFASTVAMVLVRQSVFGQAAHILAIVVGSCTLVVIIAAVVDYALQVFEFARDQRMSLDDVRREYRDAEGDPHVKAQRRAQRRELAQGRGARQTKRKPTVVVTNPTHVAVALFYEPGGDPPTVIDKGLDEVAFQIKLAAWRLEVPVLEDPPLARRLYRAVAIDEVIENELFDAVAEVLVWARRTTEAALKTPKAAQVAAFSVASKAADPRAGDRSMN